MVTAHNVLAFPDLAGTGRSGTDVDEATRDWSPTLRASNKWLLLDGPAARMGRADEPRTTSLDFGYPLPDGSKLTDPRNSEWLELAKRYAELLREHPSSRIDTVQLHKQQAQNLFLLMAWMRLEQISHFADLRASDIERYAQSAQFGMASVLRVAERAMALRDQGVDVRVALPVRRRLHLGDALKLQPVLDAIVGGHAVPTMKPLTHNPYFRMLLVAEQLWDFRREIAGDNIRIDPYVISASARAQQDCSDTDRTPDIPARIAMTMVDGCIRILAEVAPTVVRLREAIEEKLEHTRLSTRARVLSSFQREHADNLEFIRSRLHVETERGASWIIELATEQVMLACAVIIAVFSARRHEEVISIRQGCIIGPPGGLFVYSAILKNEKSNQHTPVPTIVAKAVECLEAISASARAITGKSKLFARCRVTSRDMGKPASVSDALAFDLDQLSAACGVPDHEGGKFRFTMRQFRRFFAIAYMWRHENADLMALCLHLRHWSPEQTRAYCTDRTLGRIFHDEERNYTRAVVRGIVDGTREVGGATGIRLTALIKRRKASHGGMVAMTAERAVAWVDSLAERLVVRCNPWSYCTCPDTRRGADDAHCREDGVAGAAGPDFSAATPETCIGCKHRMTAAIFTPFLENEERRCGRMLASPRVAGTAFGRATAARHATIRGRLLEAQAEGVPA